MYDSIKQAMKDAGYSVSAEGWGAADTANFKDFARFTLGLSPAETTAVLQYPETFKGPAIKPQYKPDKVAKPENSVPSPAATANSKPADNVFDVTPNKEQP